MTFGKGSYLNGACFDTTELADQGSGTDLEGLSSAGIEFNATGSKIDGIAHSSSDCGSREKGRVAATIVKMVEVCIVDFEVEDEKLVGADLDSSR